jgi:hypothetical protein
MKKFPNLDPVTLYNIIENNIQSKHDESSSPPIADSNSDSSLIISPTNDVSFLN